MILKAMNCFKLIYCFIFRFVLFGGNVCGKYDEIIPNKKITQTWRLKQWPAGHYSNVVMELVQKVSRSKGCCLGLEIAVG